MTKRVLIISFDLVRKGEANVSFAIGSMLAYLKNYEKYGEDFIVEHKSFNMLDLKDKGNVYFFEQEFLPLDFSRYDLIAVSCYVWNEYLINPLMTQVRAMGFRGKFALGGYQISYGVKDQLKFEYPEGDIFIFGYAEESLLKAILLPKSEHVIYLNETVKFANIPSVYISNEIPIKDNQAMIRWETKRGCPYKCSFCAHRDLNKNQVYKHEEEKVISELSLFKSKNVGRVNIIDPVFNVGKSYLKYMKEIYDLDLKSEITLQSRFEMIRGEEGKTFLDLAEKINSHLEFGIQTVIPKEYNTINRPNDNKLIKVLLQELKSRNISYEISLIYGLPHQTLSSFQYSIDFLQSVGCENITAYPLMLLKGTELYAQKEAFGFVEKEFGDFKIPTVISSNSYTEGDWTKMVGIAAGLDANNRI